MAKTRTYDLREERDRIDSELDGVAEDVAALEAGNPLLEQRAQRGRELERQWVGLQWALNADAAGDERDRDVYGSVTIEELTAGTYLRAGSRAEADTAELDVPNGTDIQRLYRVASAIEDADFLSDDPDFDETLVTVAELKPQFFAWLESRVDDVSTPEVEGNGFAARVAAAESDETESSESQ